MESPGQLRAYTDEGYCLLSFKIHLVVADFLSVRCLQKLQQLTLIKSIFISLIILLKLIQKNVQVKYHVSGFTGVGVPFVWISEPRGQCHGQCHISHKTYL